MGGAPCKSAKSRGGWCSFKCTFNYESAFMSCLQRLNALEANNWTNNNIQRSHSRFNVKSWWHATLWMALCHCEHGPRQLSVRTTLAMSVYAKMPAVKYYAICITLVAVLLKLYVKLTPRINFYPIQEIGPKVGGGCSFMMGAFSQDYSLYLTHLCSKYDACPYHVHSLETKVLCVNKIILWIHILWGLWNA